MEGPREGPHPTHTEARQFLATEGPAGGSSCHPCLHHGWSQLHASQSPPVPHGPQGAPAPVPASPYLMMSCRARSSGFCWYSMPCLAHRDLTSGATLCRLCRGMVGKRLGRVRGAGREEAPTSSHSPLGGWPGPGDPVHLSLCAHRGGWHVEGEGWASGSLAIKGPITCPARLTGSRKMPSHTCRGGRHYTMWPRAGEPLSRLRGGHWGGDTL